MRHSSEIQPANYQTSHQSNIYTPVCSIVLVTGVLLIVKAVTHKQYRAKILRRQINKLETMWSLESRIK